MLSASSNDPPLAGGFSSDNPSPNGGGIFGVGNFFERTWEFLGVPSGGRPLTPPSVWGPIRWGSPSPHPPALAPLSAIAPTWSHRIVHRRAHRHSCCPRMQFGSPHCHHRCRSHTLKQKPICAILAHVQTGFSGEWAQLKRREMIILKMDILL